MKKTSLQKLLPGLKRNVLLKNYTTFKIGGAAQFFFVAKNKKDVMKAVQTSKKLKLPFFILGEGSNLLISDRGFKGLVVKIRNTKYEIPRTRTSSVRGRQNILVYAEAGVSFPVLVKATTELGLSGLEWAGGLPGTLGGAIRGNAGAFRGEIKDVILEVEALDEKGNLKTLSRKQCNFSYRSSIFKKNNWIVLSTALKLGKGNKKLIQSIAKSHIRYREEKHPLEYPNAGSIFKNCDLKKIPKRLRASFNKVVKTDPFPLIPSAHLISEAGLKGLRVGQAEVSTKHPNYIVNLGNTTAKDVIKLINLVKKEVKDKFGIVLEEEIKLVGF
ncbi:UDP-N-acetylmuramate dehydrogenase [Patescibacteria group bacterium]|nr:UDP-N-acetylmuramate dehydrogenase [Patescibacteria group bacterium]